MDIDYAAGRITFDHADELIRQIESQGLKLEWIIETHVHADHLSAAPYIQERWAARSASAQDHRRAGRVRQGLQRRHRVPARRQPVRRAVRGWRHLHGRGDAVLCHVYARAHTRLHGACDGRCGLRRRHAFHARWRLGARDFPGGSAGTLYDSIQKVLALPDEMRLFMCHDYGPNGRDIQWETTVAEEKAHNIHVGGARRRKSS
jgi:glyoxylase-like metal-dependent hydrolase (beta-lactamase superfamily II)